MAKKRIKTEVKPVLTKRQLSRHKRQERIQHIIYISGAVFLVVLIAFLGYGIWNEQVKPFHQPALKINGVTYDTDYYIKYLDIYSKGMDATQITSTADNIPKIIQYNQAVIKSAPELGISVSNDDISKGLKTVGFPDDKARRDAVEASMLVNSMMKDYFDKQVPASMEQVNTQALLVESADTADKLRARLAAGDNFTAMASENSLDPLTKDNGGKLGWLPKGFADVMLGSLGNSVLKDVPFTLQAGELSQPIFDGMVTKPIGYWVVQVTEKDPQKGSHVRGILTGSRNDADMIREKIVAGDDFATLVKTYSQDSISAAKDGELGWTSDGSISNRLVLGLAGPLDTGGVSQPATDTSVKTVGGFWLVKALDRDDNRELDSNTRQTLVTGLFENWVGGKMKNDSVETLLTDEQKAWAINIVVKSRG